MGFTDALELFVAGSGGETFQRTPPSKEELDRVRLVVWSSLSSCCRSIPYNISF